MYYYIYSIFEKKTSMPENYFIYRFKEFDNDKFIELYRESCTKTFILDYSESYNDINIPVSKEDQVQIKDLEPVKIPVKPRKPLQSEEKITWKGMFLCHAIIYRCSTNEHGHAPVNAEILKAVLGPDYRNMLDVLIQMNLIERIHYENAPDYLAGYYSTNYQLLHKTELFQTSNRTIIKYIEKLKSLLKNYYQYKEKQLEDLYGARFKENYMKSLNMVKIKDKEGLQSYVREQIKQNPDKRNYYNYVIDYISRGHYSIFNIDKSRRIYHVLTSLQRELKQYLNIKYQIDARNSHPVLFIYFIFNYKNISISSSNSIINFILSKKEEIETQSNHYVGKYLYNELKNNNIELDEITKLSPDELAYIYMTSTGQFWDEFLARHTEVDRNELKQIMFAEVFYSNKVGLAWKKFGKEFAGEYPSVYKLIARWKNPAKDKKISSYIKENDIHADKETASLSVAMMKLESVIFHDILSNLYAKRIRAVHIHDAVIVPETKGNINITSEKLVEIMRNCYAKYGLVPSFSIDFREI